ncbi:IclR family transcriptional regulator [Haloterrigena sp. SYSU A121-1]|uniref:IclR family transcriptional regulator n=1 Tax=Haloterrigena gelatinilytica TaxID=2741724 RepID=A0A8J8GRX6_9EURY|nr:IclR family transcriptional regulator [Haloterrigena gelatinilytica]NUB93412.1 IclR family transcriptional regulator [Haloterrigena gelatinilytica]
MESTDKDEDWELSSVRRAFNILEIIDENDGIGIDELADRENMPRSTAHIYLKSLAKTGFVVEEDGTYRLSLQFLEYGGRVRRKRKLYHVGKDEIKDLADKTGEVASLGIEENGKRVLIYKSEGGDAIYDRAPTGERTNLHWTALGKVILAYLPSERVDAIVEEHGLPELTEHTVTTRDSLRDELETIRERGYSLEDEERRSGVRSIAVPVQPDSEAVVGAVSLTGPKSKFTDERIESELLSKIENAVNVIEIRYNHY